MGDKLSEIGEYGVMSFEISFILGYGFDSMIWKWSKTVNLVPPRLISVSVIVLIGWYRNGVNR